MASVVASLARLTLRHTRKNDVYTCSRIFQGISQRGALSLCGLQVNRHVSLTGRRLVNADSQDQDDEQETTQPLRRVVDVETSKAYLNSKAYQTTYLGAKVWEPYRRNHKGPIPPEKTRKKCIRAGVMATGNPCPICRDEYLVVHPTNVDLLKQFVSPHTGELLSYKKTGLCQVQHKAMKFAILQAWDAGYLEKSLPFRQYSPEDYQSSQS